MEEDCTLKIISVLFQFRYSCFKWWCFGWLVIPFSQAWSCFLLGVVPWRPLKTCWHSLWIWNVWFDGRRSKFCLTSIVSLFVDWFISIWRLLGLSIVSLGCLVVMRAMVRFRSWKWVWGHGAWTGAWPAVGSLLGTAALETKTCSWSRVSVQCLAASHFHHQDMKRSQGVTT